MDSIKERVEGLPEWPDPDNGLRNYYFVKCESALARLALAREAIQGALDATAIGDDVAFSALSRDDVIALLKALEVPRG